MINKELTDVVFNTCKGLNPIKREFLKEGENYIMNFTFPYLKKGKTPIDYRPNKVSNIFKPEAKEIDVYLDAEMTTDPTTELTGELSITIDRNLEKKELDEFITINWFCTNNSNPTNPSDRLGACTIKFSRFKRKQTVEGIGGEE